MNRIFKSLTDAKLIELLGNGAVGVLPDTVYGLVCRAADEQAVKRLYNLKKRENKPGTVIAANIEQLVELGVTRRYLKAVEQFWPAAISVIIPVGSELSYLDLGAAGLAMRIPKLPTLVKLLEQTGPLLTSSANQPGKPVADTLAEAQAYFGSEVDFYVDGGDLSGRLPSTLIRIVDDAIEILHEGAVKIDEAGRVVT